MRFEKKVEKGYIMGKERALYYWSLICSSALPRGVGYEDLPRIFVIMLCEKDYLGKGVLSCRMGLCLRHTGEIMSDKLNIIYISGESADRSTRLGRVVHDLGCVRADNMLDPIMASRMRRIKETKEGVGRMDDFLMKYFGDAYDMGVSQGIEQGVEQGRAGVQSENVRRMLSKGRGEQEICECLGLTSEEFRKAAAQARPSAK